MRVSYADIDGDRQERWSWFKLPQCQHRRIHKFKGDCIRKSDPSWFIIHSFESYVVSRLVLQRSGTSREKFEMGPEVLPIRFILVPDLASIPLHITIKHKYINYTSTGSRHSPLPSTRKCEL